MSQHSAPTAKKYDGTKAYPLSSDFASHPTPLRYHRFEDATGAWHEIFVAPGKEQEILDLDEAKNYAALLKFPRFSDRPARQPIRANVLQLQRDDGREPKLWLGEDDEGIDRAIELSVAKDYDALEREYEVFSKFSVLNGGRGADLGDDQVHSSKREYEEWVRGVERCARARDEVTEK